MGVETDPIRGFTEPGRYWTTANVGEAATDVMTPLCWSVWARGNELSALRSWAYFGVVDDDDVCFDDDQNTRITGIFYGRVAMNMDVVVPLMARLPGVTARDFELGMTGTAREGLPEYTTDPDRLAVIAAKSGTAAEEHHDVLTRNIEDTDAWWREVVLGGRGEGTVRDRLLDARARFEDALYLHINTRFLFSGVMGRVYALAAEAGHMELVTDVLAAFGDVEEGQLAEALNGVANDHIELGEFIERFGFHGTHEGNPSGRSWREDPSQLDAILESLADRPNSFETRAQAALDQQRAALEVLCEALPPEQADVLRAIMGAAAQVTRDIELGKGAFLKTIDGIRAAARELGRELVDAGVIDDVDDVFFFSIDELIDDRIDEVRVVVPARRASWLEYRGYTIPTTFTGMPEPVKGQPDRASVGDEIKGVPGSAGLCEGRVRVIDDPTDFTLAEGDVLVCRMTDPSWTPLFMLAEGLVIDIGGLGSHGAIVAREMGIPCVINTVDGSQRLRDGDLVRVDGRTGTVTVLEAGSAS